MLNQFKSFNSIEVPVIFAQTMRRKFCTFFLLLVLAIKILPVRQMGRALFGSQFTEELPHSCADGKDCLKKAESKSDFLYTPDFNLASLFIESTFQYADMSTAIPLNPSADIHVPPPNC